MRSLSQYRAYSRYDLPWPAMLYSILFYGTDADIASLAP
jgi:hypothetical protein